MPASPQGAERCVAGHPGEEASRDGPNFSLVSLPRDRLQPDLPSGRCPRLPVETAADHVHLRRVRTTCFCCGQGGERGCLRAGASKGESRGCSPASSSGAARAVAILRESQEQSPSEVSLPRICRSPRLWLQWDKLPRSQTLGCRAKPPQGKGFPQLWQGRVWRCRSGRALGGKPDKAPAPPSCVEKHP